MSINNLSKLPQHVGIIMDGNGRWAKSRGLPRVAGHKQGAHTVDTIVTACRKAKISSLTLYAFSAQNWSRPSLEVKALMALLSEYIKSKRNTILDNNIRLCAIGEIASLPKETKKQLLNLIDESSVNDGMNLCLALSYGGREEIVNACKAVSQKVKDGALQPEEINIEMFEKHLWSSFLGPVDLMIRTSGEIRLSNFLLWSCAYSEFYFSQKMWPEFDETDLHKAFTAYADRERRFGKLR